MRCLSLSHILLLISAASILIAISVAGYTVAKSVKWTFYNEAIDYGYGTILYMYAYQNLWTSYDAWKIHDLVYTKVFVPTRFRDGGLLVSCLIFYKRNYQSILSVLFNDPASKYPDKDNISVGFYLTAFASAMFFASSIFNIANAMIHMKASQASIQPSSGPPDI